MITPLAPVGVELAGAVPLAGPTASSGVAGFERLIASGLDHVNQDVATAEHGAQMLAVGATDNLPEVMLGIENARASLALMVQVRDRLVEAYREVLQMQI